MLAFAFLFIVCGCLAILPRIQTNQEALPTVDIYALAGQTLAAKDTERARVAPPKSVSIDLSSPIPTIEPSPIMEPTSTLQPFTDCIRTNERVQGVETEIIDGVTIKVKIGDQISTVKYIGIDTPEANDIFGPKATARNAELVGGKNITLVKDVSEVDRYDSLLRYIFVGNLFVNQELVRTGFAHQVDYPPDSACVETLKQAEQEAQTAAIGMWEKTRSAEIKLPTTTVAATGLCPQGCLEEKPGCNIKGNISSEDEKTIIDSSKGERWFCTPEEAVQNGWRHAKQ